MLVLIVAGATLGVGVVLVPSPDGAPRAQEPQAAAAPFTTGMAFEQPPVVRSRDGPAEATLVARNGRVAISGVNVAETQTYATRRADGSTRRGFLGPTLRVRRGDRIELTLDSTLTVPVEGTPGDAALTEEHNAKYPDDEQNTEYLNGMVVDWLTARAFPPSPSSPWNPQGLDYDKFLLSLLTPTYTLFSNTTSQNAWNAAHKNGPTVFALENPHNNIHVAIGGIDIPGYSRSPLPGANGDMGENDTAALEPVFYFHYCFIDYVFWTWQRRHGATQWFDIDPDDPGAIATPPNAQTPAGRGQNEQLSMDSPLNPLRIGEGPAARAIASHDVVDIGNLGYQFGPGSLDQYADATIPPLEPGPVVQVSGINRGRIAGSFVIAAHAEVDGEKQLIGYEAVLSRWHMAGCANCQLHLESKATFPVPPHLHELARSRPDAITVSVQTRRGLHGGVPIPVGAHVRGAHIPFKVELHH